MEKSCGEVKGSGSYVRNRVVEGVKDGRQKWMEGIEMSIAIMRYFF